MVSAPKRPSRIHVRMYRVGFGDAFLLTFDYRTPPDAGVDSRHQRHVLIDCGSTKRDPHGPTMAAVVAQIEADCGGTLDVIVVTHRHSDHLSAWDTAATATIMDRLQPRLVVRPWTDDPAAPIDATGPVDLDDDSRRFAAALRAGQDAAGLIGHALRSSDSRSLQGELANLALDQLANKTAIERLERYAKDSDVAYVSYGGDTRVSQYVPGVDVDVLGPPTVAQWPDITSQRSEDPDEFWMLNRHLVEAGFTETGIDPVDPARWRVLLGDDGIGPARWLLERLDQQRVASLLRIVRTFDDSLNNTSVILLFKVGRRRLLFSGDAQIENWSFVLTGSNDSSQLREQLRHVDLYKVGHHGSRNATPRSLFKLWNDTGAPYPMVSLMSTLAGVHGRRASTAVPRATLVNALRERTRLYSTDELPDDESHVHVAASTSGTGSFAREG